MNLSTAIQKGKEELKAVRGKDWPLNLAWYHGMDNVIRWYNSDPDSPCVYKTGDQVNFAVADFLNDGFELHPEVHFHGDLHERRKEKRMEDYQECVRKEKEELDERITRIVDFMGTDEWNSLPSDELWRLNRQEVLMELYSEILGERIAAFEEAEEVEGAGSTVEFPQGLN